MPSTPESGHLINLNNFEKMIAINSSFGPAYQPSKSTLQIAFMQEVLAEAKQRMQVLNERLHNYTQTKNVCNNLFDEFPTLASRVVNALAATDTDEKTVEDARKIMNKIRGVRLGKKEKAANPTETLTAVVASETADGITDLIPATTATIDHTNGESKDTKSRSSAQTSRDRQIDHFSRLLLLLGGEIHYNPNEQDLQLFALQQYLENMRTIHSAMMVQEAELSAARIQRDEILYIAKASVYAIAKDVKAYAKSAFGVKSPQYKQLSKLQFTRPR